MHKHLGRARVLPHGIVNNNKLAIGDININDVEHNLQVQFEVMQDMKFVYHKDMYICKSAIWRVMQQLSWHI